MMQSDISKNRRYNYEVSEILIEEPLNYKRLEEVFDYGKLEQILINTHIKCKEMEIAEENNKKQEWKDKLKIRDIPENCGYIKKKKISLINDFRYLKAFFLYKKEYAEFTSANKELRRIVPILTYTLFQAGVFLISIYSVYMIYIQGIKMSYAIILFLCAFFFCLFRMAKIEINETKNEEQIENSFEGTVAILGLIVAIITIAIDFKSDNRSRNIIKPVDCSYSINIDQIAFISDVDIKGEHIIYFSNGATLSIPQSTYEEIYSAWKK